MFTKNNEKQVASQKIQKPRVLGRLVGKELNGEELKLVSGGEGGINSNVGGTGSDNRK